MERRRRHKTQPRWRLENKPLKNRSGALQRRRQSHCNLHRRLRRPLLEQPGGDPEKIQKQRR